MDGSPSVPCYFCGHHTSTHGGPTRSFCRRCEEEHELLIRGLQAEYSGIPVHVDPRPEQSIRWYQFAGVRDTIINIRQKPSENLKTYRDSFREKVRELGVKPALTYLLLHYYISELAMDERPSNQGDVGLPPKMTQYGVAVAATVPPIPTFESLTSATDRTELLNEIPPADFRGGYQSRSNRVYGQLPDEMLHDLRGVFAATKSDIDPIDRYGSRADQELAFAVQESDVITGQIADPSQYVDAMERQYTPFQYAFLRHRGIDIVKAVTWVRRLLALFYRRTEEIYQYIRWYQADCLRILGALEKASTESDLEIIDFLNSSRFSVLKLAELESWAHLVDSAERRLWFSESELASRVAPHNKARFQIFLDRISQAAGKYEVGGPRDLNPLEKCPIVRVNGEYLLPVPLYFGYSIATTFYYDLINLQHNGKLELSLSGVRGEVFENWTSDFLRRVFSSKSIATNIEYSDPDGEIDVLIKHEDTLIAVEVKSKLLTLGARRGDLTTLKRDIEDGIGAAAHQANERIDLIESGEIAITEDEHGIDIDPTSVERYIPVVIIGGHYDRIGTIEYTSVIDDSLRTPYVVSPYGLDVVTRLLTPEGFIDYVQQRIAVAKRRQIMSVDEMDYLGAFLDNSLAIYEDPFVAETFDLAAEDEGLNIMAPIAGKDELVLQHLPEFQRGFTVSWLP